MIKNRWVYIAAALVFAAGAIAAQEKSAGSKVSEDVVKPRAGDAGKTAPAEKSGGKPMRVLFIGASTTGWNGPICNPLPAMAEAHGKNMECATYLKGGTSLQSHWAGGLALKRIQEGNWDFVVLQETSTGWRKDGEQTLEAVREFDAEIKKVGARTILYLVWANRDDPPEVQKRITELTEKTAKAVGAMVSPVGLAFARARERKSDIDLYATHIGDKHHPGALGTYLSTCVFYSVLFNESPEGSPLPTIQVRGDKTKNIPGAPYTLTKEEASFIQKTAWECVVDYKKTKGE